MNVVSPSSLCDRTNLPAASAAIGTTIRLPILLPIGLAVHLAVLLTIHLAILLPVSLSVLLTIFPSIRLAVLLPICPPIFLTDITNLGEYHVRHDGWDCHGHD